MYIHMTRGYLLNRMRTDTVKHIWLNILFICVTILLIMSTPTTLTFKNILTYIVCITALSVGVADLMRMISKLHWVDNNA